MRNVQKLRKLYGKTQLEISNAIDYPKPLYVAFERGRIDLPPRQIQALCEYFNVTEEYLRKETEE